MDSIWIQVIGSQFEAAIDMLDSAITACPDELWRDRTHKPEYWYVAYHALFFLDLYLSGTIDGFVPPAPFTLDELDPAGILPDRVYEKHELKAYLEHSRAKCRATLQALTDERAYARCNFSWLDMTFAELVLDNMRHVQEHASQLLLILGQRIEAVPGYVSKSKR
jgi:hypothetical protein